MLDMNVAVTVLAMIYLSKNKLVGRAESIHLLRGTVRAKVRSRTSVEALQNQQVSNTPGGVMAKAITPLSLLMNTLSSSN